MSPGFLMLDAKTQACLEELSTKLGKTQAEIIEMALADMARRTHHNGARWYVEK